MPRIPALTAILATLTLITPAHASESAFRFPSNDFHQELADAITAKIDALLP